MKTAGAIILVLACFTPVTAAWMWVYFGMTGAQFIATLITVVTFLLLGAFLYGKAVIDKPKR